MQLFKFFHTKNQQISKHKQQKNGGFCEELLIEHDFEAVLANFCCYEYDANVSETVQKISGGGVGGILRFFSKPPHKNRCPPMGWGAAHLKMKPPHLKNTPLPPLKHEKPFHEMIPRTSTINNRLKSS